MTHLKITLLLIVTLLVQSVYSQCVTSPNMYVTNSEIGKVRMYWYSYNPGKSYTIEYGLSGFTLGTGTEQTGISETNNFVSILALQKDQLYDFYMFETCEAGNNTDTLSYSLTTYSECEQRSSVGVYNEDVGTIEVNWSSWHIGENYTIEYGYEDFVMGTGSVVTGTSEEYNNVIISGLDADTKYDVYMFESCAAGGNTDTTHGSVTTLELCPTASYLNGWESGIGGVRIAWSSFNAGETYYIEYGLLGFTQGSGTQISGTSEENNYIYIENLQGSTAYDFYMYESCAVGGYSDTLHRAVTTIDDCSMDNFYANANGIGSVSLYWNSYHIGQDYTIEYGLSGFTMGTGTTLTGISEANNGIEVEGLEGLTEYDFYIYEICETGGTTDTLYDNATTMSSCPTANYFDADNSNIGKVRLSWQTYHVGQPYTIEYGLSGFTQGEGTVISGTNTDTYNYTYIEGLEASTSYDFYLHKTCANGEQTDTTYTSITTYSSCEINDDFDGYTTGIGRVRLEWHSFHIGETYTIEYGPSGFVIGTGETITGISEDYNTRTIEGLEASSSYDFYLQETCEAGGSTEHVFMSLTTISDCQEANDFNAYNTGIGIVRVSWSSYLAGQQFVLEYGLEGFTLGTGTTITGLIDNSSSVYIPNLQTSTSYDFYMYELCSNGNTTDTLFDNITSFPECQSAIYPNAYNSGVGKVRVNWNSYQIGETYTIEYGLAGFEFGTGTQVTGYSMSSNNVNISNLQAETAYDFYLYETCMAGGYTDTIKISETTLDACITSGAYHISNQGIGTVRLSWYSYHEDQQYTIEYGLQGFTPGTGQITTGVSNNYYDNDVIISGLENETAYDFYVFEACENGGNTDTFMLHITTLPACMSSDLDVHNFNIGQVRVYWNSIHIGETYTLEYGLTGFERGSGTILTGNSQEQNIFVIEGLETETAYDFYMSETCAEGGNTEETYRMITTMVSCPELYGVNMSTTSDALLFIWESYNEGETYTFEYGVSGFIQGEGTVLTGSVEHNNDLFIGELLPNTVYQVYLTETCASGELMETNEFVFQTRMANATPSNDLCDNAEEVFMGANFLTTLGAGNSDTPTDNCVPELVNIMAEYTYGAWFKYTAIEDNNIEFSVCSGAGTLDPKLVIYSGICSDLVCEGHVFDCKKSIQVSSGIDYYIFVYDEDLLNTGNFLLNISVDEDYESCEYASNFSVQQINNEIHVEWLAINDYVIIWGPTGFDLINDDEYIWIEEGNSTDALNSMTIANLDTAETYDLYLAEFCNDRTDIEFTKYSIIFNSIEEIIQDEDQIYVSTEHHIAIFGVKDLRQEKLEIYSVTGQKLAFKLRGNEIHLVSKAAPGVYLLTIRLDDRLITKKFIIE